MAEEPTEISDYDFRRTMIAMGRVLVVLIGVLILVGVLNLIELRDLNSALGL